MAKAIRVAASGAADWVGSVQRLAEESRLGDVVIVDAGDDDPSRAHERLLAVLDDVDAVVVDGRIHHDRLLTERPDLPIPAIYLPVTRPMIYPTLIRCLRTDEIDIERLSIDSVDDGTIRELYETVGVPWKGVRTVQYHGLDTTEHYIDFHESLFRQGVTTGALTSKRVVVAELGRRGVPVLKLAGPEQDNEERLRGAIAMVFNLASSTRLPDSQLVIGEVAVARATLSGEEDAAGYWQQELGLEVHKILLSGARTMGGAVTAKGPLEFTVTSTMSGFRRVTRGLRAAPFLQRIRSELGVVANAGFGIGDTTAEAATNARVALGRAETTNGNVAVLIDPEGAALSLPVVPEVAPPRSGNDEFLSRLVAALRAERAGESAEALIVDGATVAKVMEISERSARRRLDALVQHGAAWPMKSMPTSQGGRPRLHYRLVESRTLT